MVPLTSVRIGGALRGGDALLDAEGSVEVADADEGLAAVADVEEYEEPKRRMLLVDQRRRWGQPSGQVTTRAMTAVRKKAMARS